MRSSILFFAFAIFAFTQNSCRNRVDQESSVKALGARLLPPPAGTPGNRMDVAAVVNYWNEEADMFYGKIMAIVVENPSVF